MHMVTASIVLAVTFAAAPAAPAQHQRDTKLPAVVERFVKAETQFDVATLKELTAESYVEISPIGDVDPREKLLGFYAPELKVAMPDVTISEVEVYPFAHSAILLAKLSYTLPGPNGTPNAMALRASFVADETPSGWKLLSAQYTGIRPAKQQN